MIRSGHDVLRISAGHLICVSKEPLPLCRLDIAKDVSFLVIANKSISFAVVITGRMAAFSFVDEVVHDGLHSFFKRIARSLVVHQLGQLANPCFIAKHATNHNVFTRTDQTIDSPTAHQNIEAWPTSDLVVS